MASQPPYREIRALHDSETITVYQAYNTSIADAAVRTQKLDASSDFKPGRMTWIKPSWAWMMYRSGYSYKDPGQARILALRMRHEHFIHLLEKGVLASHGNAAGGGGTKNPTKGPQDRTADVRVQWDPERSVKLEVLPYRSIQIGIPGALSKKWACEWVSEIEDVTDKARSLQEVLDGRPGVTVGELAGLGLVPLETPYPVPDAIRSKLEM